MVIVEIIKEVDIVCQFNIEEEGFVILILVYIYMGEVVYGVFVGYGEIYLIIRIKIEEEMQALSDWLLSYVGWVF